MALKFPTPTELGDQYLTIVKSLKPEVDISRQDSDWWVRSRAVGGVNSGIYADQRKIADDAFPQNSRREGIEKHLFTYFGEGFIQPQSSSGDIGVTGLNGTVIPAGTEWVYTPSGNSYQSTADVTLAGISGLVPVQSIDEGQNQNLLSGAALLCSSPPSGLNQDAVAVGPIGGGRNVESNTEAVSRILSFIQRPPAGGTASDYERFAKEGSPQVVDASVIRFIRGLGTVGIVITAGTTDIDAALDSGVPVVREPSQTIIDAVQAYVDTKKVETDCVDVVGPEVVSVNVSVTVRLANGTLSTVDPVSGLTYQALIQREVKRAIYKTPPGGRQIHGSGFLVAADIESVLDLSLGSTFYVTGKYAELLLDRQVGALDGVNVDLALTPLQMAEPGTITVTLMT